MRMHAGRIGRVRRGRWVVVVRVRVEMEAVAGEGWSGWETGLEAWEMNGT